MWGNIQGIGISPRKTPPPPPKVYFGYATYPKGEKKEGKNDLRHFEKWNAYSYKSFIFWNVLWNFTFYNDL